VPRATWTGRPRPSRAQQLRDEAERLYLESMGLADAGDFAMAESEIIMQIQGARLEVQHVEAELAGAREQLAAATMGVRAAGGRP